jgi:hypothetical protein
MEFEAFFSIWTSAIVRHHIDTNQMKRSFFIKGGNQIQKQHY